MPLLPTERLEVCKLCPSFLLWRGVLWGCWIPYTWSNIHGNTGGRGLWVHGLKHSCPSRPCTHKTTHWDSAEFSGSSAILKVFQSDLDHSNEIPETKKRPPNGTPSTPSGSCLSHRLQTISSQIPFLININVIHKREASIKKNDFMNFFILCTGAFQMNSVQIPSFLVKT